MHKWMGQFALVSVLLLSVGCGGSGSPFDYVTVSGELTYEDGTPIPAQGIKLVFNSLAPPVGDAHPRPGSVIVGADGSFKDVTSYKYADGLVPGEHKVSILYATDEKGKLLVPTDYTKAASTPLTVHTENSPLKILVPRPN